MTNKFIARTVCVCFFFHRRRHSFFRLCGEGKKPKRLLQWKFTSSFCKFSRDLLMAVYQMISSCVRERDWATTRSGITDGLRGSLECQPARESSEKKHYKLCSEKVYNTLGLIVTRCSYNLLIYYQQNCLFFTRFCNIFHYRHRRRFFRWLFCCSSYLAL